MFEDCLLVHDFCPARIKAASNVFIFSAENCLAYGTGFGNFGVKSSQNGSLRASTHKNEVRNRVRSDLT